MINKTLYVREMKRSVKMLLIFTAVITMYVCIIIEMYDPEMKKLLESFNDTMPELMAAVGMNSGTGTLPEFMVSYLYGFILPVFPMIFSILRSNGLVAKYTESGSMAVLIAAPIKRRKVILTQLSVLLSGVLFLVLYTTCLELIYANSRFPDELEVRQLLKLNTALLFLHLFIAGICFLASSLFSETKYSISFGAGIPSLMFVLQMLANSGEKAEKIKYFTFFTLFDPAGIINGEANAFYGAKVLLTGAVLLYIAACICFCRKDLHL